MIHPAGETVAATLSLSKGRDSRPGCGRKAGAWMTIWGYPRAPLQPFGPSPNASENSRLPRASESLISEGPLSSSR